MEKYGICNKKTYNPINFQKLSIYNKDLITSLLIGIIDGDSNISKNGSSNSFCIKITSHNCWYNFYKNEIELLPEF
jgi:hypothetical protein